jgi:hypothetical protein
MTATRRSGAPSLLKTRRVPMAADRFELGAVAGDDLGAPEIAGLADDADDRRLELAAEVACRGVGGHRQVGEIRQLERQRLLQRRAERLVAAEGQARQRICR